MKEHYNFSANWSDRAQSNWQEHLSHLTHTKLVYLEIGVFEGRFSCWMLDNILTHPESRYIGIDSWPFYENRDGHIVETTARTNLASHAAKVELIRGDSQWVLRQPRWQPETVDVGYIDGDHGSEAVLTDSVLLWPLIKAGGILIWDDCSRRKKNLPVRRAIKAFLSCIPGRYVPVFTQKLQFAVRKIQLETPIAT